MTPILGYLVLAVALVSFVVGLWLGWEQGWKDRSEVSATSCWR